MRLHLGSMFGALLRNLGVQGNRAAVATGRIASGVGVRTAADDPLGMTRSTRFQTQAASARAAMRNISAGISLLATADGALAQVAGLLHRARELAVQAANGSLTAADRARFQAELAQVRGTIDQVAGVTFNGAPIFGAYGFGYGQVYADQLADATGIAAFVNARLAGDRVRLDGVGVPLFSDSFTDLSGVNGALTTAAVDTGLGLATLPGGLAAAMTDTFTSLARVDPGLTTALVDTVGGLVRLSQQAMTRLGDTFTGLGGTDGVRTTALVDTGAGYVTQPLAVQALFGDSFADLAGVNGALTTAMVDPATGSAYLPSAWAGALSGAPNYALGRVLNQRLYDSFGDLLGTNGVLTTAYVNTVAGLVTSPGAVQPLWSAAPGATLPGSPPGSITLGADTFAGAGNIAASGNIVVSGGVAGLLGELYTAAADTFNTLAQVDGALTTAVVDTLAGEVRLAASLASETYGDTFADLGRILAQAGVAVDTATGQVTLASTLTQVAAGTFTDGTGVDPASTGVVVDGGELRLDQAAQLDNKYSTAPVFNPGGGANGAFDSGGVKSTAIVDLGGGQLRMYYVAVKNGNKNPTIGYTTSTDGGQTWSAGTDLGIGGVTTTSELEVVRDGSGTYYLFYSTAGGVQMRASANGTSGWSSAVTAVSKGAYSAVGRPTVVQDSAGTWHMFYEVTSGGATQIEHATAATLDGPWTDLAGWTNLAGSGPEVVDEGNRYSLYYRDGAGQIVRATGTDLTAFSGAETVVTTGTGFDAGAVRVGGAVYDAATGVTRMLYRGSTAGGEYAVGLAYTTARTAGTFRSVVTGTADTVSKLQLNATAGGTGTIAYRVSADGGVTWQDVAPGSTVDVAPGQQVLLEATLTNTAGVNGGGPTLQDFSLSAPLYDTTGQFTSTAYTFSRAVDNITLNATDSGGVAYAISTDGGTTWQAVSAGTRLDLGTATTSVQVRATLTTADRGLTPVLSDYSVSAEYSQYDATGYLYTQNFTYTDSIQSFDLAATQSGSVAWEYSADGGATWQAAALGTNTLAAPTQQLQLRARLDAGGGGATTPVVSDYTVTAQRYKPSGSLTSVNYTFASPVTEITLNAAESLAPGTGMAYEISTDGGATWQAIANGGTVTLGAPATQLALRAAFTTTDRFYGPTLDGYTLTGQTAGYPADSYYVSPVQSVGFDVQNVTLNVTENTPAGTGITYELSTDGGATWQAVTPGSNVAVAPGRDLVLRAHLASSDPNVTPELVSYSVETNVKQSGTTWYANATALPFSAAAVKLTATESLPAGTAIQYEVSADGGATWTAVANGAVTDLAAPGSNLLVRATLTSSDPNLAAELLDLRVETYDYDTAGIYTSAFQTLASPVTEVRLDSVGALLPAGTGMTYQVTNDGGTTWQAVAPGGTAIFAGAGSQVGFRALLTGDGSATPVLQDFSLSVPGYSSGKYVYSTVRSFADDVTNVTLNVNAAIPAGTGISYDVSTDGGATWTAVAAGANTLVPAGRDLVFRAFLTSTDPGATPELLDYSLSTNTDTSGVQWYSAVANTGAPVDQVRLSVNESAPAGTAIAYDVSTDGGATWQALAPGAWTAVTPGADLQVRATFTSTNPDHATFARLLDYTLESREYASPQVFQSTVQTLATPTDQVRLDVNANTPAGTGLTYEVSVDGGATWAAATPGVTTAFAAAGNQLVFRATLSGTGTATPELLDYTLSVPGYSPGGVVYSTIQNLGAPMANVVLSANAVTPGGTSIQYAVSADGGSTWQPVTPGVETALLNPGDQLVLRAVLQTLDPAVAPQLLDWSAETRDYSAPGGFTSQPIALPEPSATVRLDATASLNGGSVAYELSNDGGLTWYSATPGADVTFAAPGSQVLLRATLTGGAVSPEVLGFSLSSRGAMVAVPSQFGFQSGPVANDRLEISLPWANSLALGIAGLDLGTPEGAAAALPALDAALTTLGGIRASAGAQMNRLESAYRVQLHLDAALQDTASRIADADLARETLDLARAQLLYEGGTLLMSSALESRRSQISGLLGALPQDGWWGHSAFSGLGLPAAAAGLGSGTKGEPAPPPPGMLGSGGFK